ncbi:MAG: MarP family serine protease [Kineosporiaceae bacterium]|nr:MarP family serine protease [Aeromicrobium sp.]
MNTLDVVVIFVLVAYAISGYVQGFVTNLVATIGLLVGGLLAISLIPKFMSGRTPTVTSSLIALAVVIGAAVVGQAIGTYVGSNLRNGLVWRPLRWVDAVGGSALSIVAVLAAAWALGYAVTGTQIPYVSTEARGSAILNRVDRVMPSGATDVLDAFNKVLDTNLFPRYLDPIENENITAVGPPDPTSLNSAGVRKAAGSVVKILGSASCNRGIEGSGFVFANDRIMTNAHVVAGVSNPFVIVGQRRIAAEVVLFDAKLDVAVLATNGLQLSPLEFDETGKAGENAAVLGYPENGPFDARAARIRMEQRLRSPDIYDEGQVIRQTFSIRSLVRSGNSGGPLVSEEGKVLGVIFAASITDSSTGYALTATQVADDARTGRNSTAPVSTGPCT